MINIGSLVCLPPHQKSNSLLGGLVTHSRWPAGLSPWDDAQWTLHLCCLASLYYATWAAPPQVDTFLFLDRARPYQEY